MIDFTGITHILKTPTEKYIAVGSVPMSMMTKSRPTPSDIMAGRVLFYEGQNVAFKQRVFDTVADFLASARANNVNLCAASGCACRKEF